CENRSGDPRSGRKSWTECSSPRSGQLAPLLGVAQRASSADMEVIWLPQAVDDLLGVHKYLKDFDPQMAGWIAYRIRLAAALVAHRIRSAVADLGEATGIGRPGRATGTSEMVISGTSYIAAYRVKETRIEIIAVLDGGHNPAGEF